MLPKPSMHLYLQHAFLYALKTSSTCPLFLCSANLRLGFWQSCSAHLPQNWIQERNVNTEIKPTPWKTLQSKVCDIVISRNQSIQEELSLDTQISGNARILPIWAYNSSLFQEKKSVCSQNALNMWKHTTLRHQRRHAGESIAKGGT